MKERVAVDSNLLIYAVESTSPKHAAAKEFLSRLVQTQSAFISVQNLAEFSRVVTEKLPIPFSSAEAEESIRSFAEVFSVIHYDVPAVVKALEFARIGKTHYFDALLAATMLENGIDTIYTENADDFAKIHGIKAINPFGQEK